MAKLVRIYGSFEKAVDCYAFVRSCAACARDRIKLRRSTEELKLFPAIGALEEVPIDLLGPFQKTPRGHTHLFVMMDRYTKLVRTAPLFSNYAWNVAQVFVETGCLRMGPRLHSSLTTDLRLAASFSKPSSSRWGVRNHFTTTYHPQTNGQVESFNRTLPVALHPCVADHPTQWDL